MEDVHKTEWSNLAQNFSKQKVSFQLNYKLIGQNINVLK